MSRFVMGVDLGCQADPSAVCVIEVTTRRDAVNAQYTAPRGELAALVSLDWFGKGDPGSLTYPSTSVQMAVRHLQRLPLRLSYPRQIALLAELAARAPLASPRASQVWDQTGVGLPVIQMARRSGLVVTGCVITSGDKETQVAPNEWRCAKSLLVSHLQAALHSGVLRISSHLAEARTLVEELQDFRAEIGESGYTGYSARSGAHDDLILATALACWWASREYHPMTTGVFSI